VLTPPPAQAARLESHTDKVTLPRDGGIAKNRLPLVLLVGGVIIALLVALILVIYFSKHG
jgi:hypothetical protein